MELFSLRLERQSGDSVLLQTMTEHIKLLTYLSISTESTKNHSGKHCLLSDSDSTGFSHSFVFSTKGIWERNGGMITANLVELLGIVKDLKKKV